MDYQCSIGAITASGLVALGRKGVNVNTRAQSVTSSIQLQPSSMSAVKIGPFSYCNLRSLLIGSYRMAYRSAFLFYELPQPATDISRTRYFLGGYRCWYDHAFCFIAPRIELSILISSAAAPSALTSVFDAVQRQMPTCDGVCSTGGLRRSEVIVAL
jgi:hypothetical protein